MAVEELVLYFLALPAFGYAIAAVWLRRAMRKIGERELGFLRERGVNSRYLVVVQNFATPTVFGLIVLIQLISVPEGLVKETVGRALGWTFATAAILTVLSQAWIFVRWRAAAFRENFAPVLVLALIPESVSVFVLIIAVLIIGRLRTSDAAEAEVLVRAARWMLLGSASAPLIAFLSNRSSVLNKKTFGRTLIGAVMGEPLVIVCLVLAFFELSQA